jgi:hypothetical protein
MTFSHANEIQVRQAPARLLELPWNSHRHPRGASRGHLYARALLSRGGTQYVSGVVLVLCNRWYFSEADALVVRIAVRKPLRTLRK